MSKYIQNIFVTLKKTCVGVSDRRERDKDNETDLKEGEIIKCQLQCSIRDARSFA